MSNPIIVGGRSPLGGMQTPAARVGAKKANANGLASGVGLQSNPLLITTPGVHRIGVPSGAMSATVQLLGAGGAGAPTDPEAVAGGQGGGGGGGWTGTLTDPLIVPGGVLEVTIGAGQSAVGVSKVNTTLKRIFPGPTITITTASAAFNSAAGGTAFAPKDGAVEVSKSNGVAGSAAVGTAGGTGGLPGQLWASGTAAGAGGAEGLPGSVGAVGAGGGGAGGEGVGALGGGAGGAGAFQITFNF